MNILMTGATGFVGRALCLRLLQDGHQLRAVVRDTPRARGALPSPVELIGWRDDAGLHAAVLSCDAIIHLAGEPIVGKRWAAEQKQRLLDSRVQTARVLAQHAAQRPTPLALVLGASAIGYYGDCGDREVDETSPAASDFAAELCVQWEAASMAISAQRHAIIRLGLVLGRGGGMLAAMAPSFKLGLGAVLGDGRAWQSWVHLDDVIALFALAVRDATMSGVYNATAPSPVTSRTFAETLAAAYGKKARLAAPRWVLRAAMGEAAALALASTRVLPKRAVAHGYAFGHPTLPSALVDLCQ